MKRIIVGSLLPVLLIFTCGYTSCAGSGLSVRENPTSYSKMVYQIVDAQGNSAATPRALSFPIALGVAQIGETAPPPELMQALQQHPELIATVTAIPLPENLFVTNEPESGKNAPTLSVNGPQALRKLGQQVGVDAILIIGGNVDSRTQSTPLEILDLAILPSVLVPSQKVNVDAKAAGTLIDVNTGAAMLLVNAASSGQKWSPSEYSSDAVTNLSLQQRGVLSKQLTDDLVKKLQLLKARQK